MKWKSLKAQILLLSSVTVVALIIIATVIFAIQQRSIYVAQYSNNTSVVSQDIHGELVRSLDAIEDQLRFLETLPTFANVIRAKNSGGTDPRTQRPFSQMLTISYVIFRAAIGSNSDYFSISLVDGKTGMELQRLDKAGDYPLADPNQELFDLSGTEYFQKSRALGDDELYISAIAPLQGPAHSDNRGRPVMQLVSAVLDEGENVGAIVVTMDIAAVFQRISQLVSSQAISDELDVYLADNSGSYLYHPDPAMVFRSVPEDETDWLDDVSQSTLIAGSATRSARTAVRGTTILRSVDFGDRSVYAQSSRFTLGSAPNSPVINQLITVPAAVVNAQILPPVINAVSVLALGGIVLAMLFAWYLLRQLAPLTALRSSARKIAAGNYRTRLPDSKIEEINTLSHSLRHLQSEVEKRESSLQASEAELTRHKADLEIKVEERTSELKAARDEANRLVRVKSDFLANMSHEIRTPMTAILGLLDILQNTELNDQQQQYFNKIRYSSKALLNIINDILDVSKIDAGKLVIEEADFSLLEALEGVVELFAPSADLKSLDLYLKIDPDIRTHIAGDRTRLAQVLHNLIGNAIKFTEAGSICVSADVIEQADTTVRVRIAVEDSGIGISTEAQQRLFEAFEQAKPDTTRVYGGTGLGLTISQKLVQLMGSELRLHSEEGKGSKFWFDIEFKKQDRPEELVLGPQCELDVLVVDDQKISCEVLSNMLCTWGCRVVTAHSGAQAMEILQKAAPENQPFDLTIAAWRLPDMDGLELAKRINSTARTSEPGCRTVIMHAEADREEIVNADNYRECLDLLVKPVVMSRLLNMLTEHDFLDMVQQPTEISDREDYANRLHKVIADLGSPGEVLLVEDNATNQIVIQELLSNYDLNISVVGNGKEGVKRVESQAFDVVLMDIQMPVMDGFEATRAIRSNRQFAELPILALSAAIFSEDVSESSKAGMNDHLVKPIDVDKLLLALIRWLPAGRNAISSESPEPGAGNNSAVVNQDDVPDRDIIASMQREPEFELEGTVLKQIGPAGALRILKVFIHEFSDVVTRWELDQIKDLEELGRIAHTIKSSAFNIGATNLLSLAKQVESAIRKDQDSRNFGKLMLELKQHLDTLRRLLET